MHRRAGFGNCDNVAAADGPSQRDRSRRAAVSGTDLRERVIGYQATILATERRIRHDWQIVLRAPSQKVTLNTSIVETVRNLIGRAPMAVGNTEEIVHVADVELDTPQARIFPVARRLSNAAKIAERLAPRIGQCSK